MKLIKENIPFTMVANEVLYNKNLSFRSKGLYAYLFSKPDTWDFSNRRIILETKDGRDAVLTMLRELEEAGYLIRKRLPTGKVEYTLIFSHQSLSRESRPRLEMPESEIAQVGNSPGGNSRPISNKEEKVISKEKVIPIAETSSAPFSFKSYLKELENDKRRHINVIGHYFEEKGITFDTRVKANTALRRHLRAAQQVANFSDNEIIEATEDAKAQYKDLWTVETVLKILTR